GRCLAPLFRPFLVGAVFLRDARVPLLASLVVFAGPFASWSTHRFQRSALFFSLFVGTTLFICSTSFSIYRYLVPLEILSPLIFCLFAQALGPHFVTPRVLGILIVSLLVGLSLSTTAGNWGRRPWSEHSLVTVRMPQWNALHTVAV